MRAYSLDLRQKIVEAYLNGQGSMRQLATQFNVARSFVQKIIQRYQDEGTLAPKPRGGQVPPKLAPEYWPIVKALVEADNDATLAELCEQLEQKTGVRISVSVMCRLLQKLNLTRKKSLSMRPKPKPNEFKMNDAITGRRSEISAQRI